MTRTEAVLRVLSQVLSAKTERKRWDSLLKEIGQEIKRRVLLTMINMKDHYQFRLGDRIVAVDDEKGVLTVERYKASP